MHQCAVLIDGAFFLKRLTTVRPDINAEDPQDVGQTIYQLVRRHLEQINELYGLGNPMALHYRTFYYDASPYAAKGHHPVSGTAIDFSKTDPAVFRKRLFDVLRSSRNVAVRLGEVRKDLEQSWTLKPAAQADLLSGRLQTADLTDRHFAPALRQKGVDMRIGLDIASLALNRNVQTIILVSADADFVPAAKLARRAGVKFILDPLWQRIPNDLNEHIDALTSGFPRPRRP